MKKKTSLVFDFSDNHEIKSKNGDSDFDDDENDKQEDEIKSFEWVDNPELINHDERKKKLSDLIDYNREKYNYCMFCGVKYESKDELESNCPGKLENLH